MFEQSLLTVAGVDMSVCTEEKMAAIALEIAMDINELPIILKNNGVSPEQFIAIERSPFFIRILDSYTQAWKAAANTPERLKIKGAILLEQVYPTLFKRMTDKTEPLNHVVQTAQFIAKTSGLGEPRDSGGGQGERFSITINLGGDTKLTFDKAHLALPALDACGVPSPVPSDPEGS